MKINYGSLLISIDFELYWGVRDERSLESYKENLEGVWKAIPKILKLFEKYEIHATWSTVGLLFCKDINEAKIYQPKIKPDYTKKNLCPYTYISKNNTIDSKFHFAPELIKEILSVPNQEISTHTFSHYYCLEKGQSLDSFKADINAALNISKKYNIDLQTIIFPRNQWNPDYLVELDKMGIKAYRGTENSWFYKSTENSEQNLIRRLGRLIDTYINLVGHQTYTLDSCKTVKPYNFPSSRLLRPYSEKLSSLEKLRARRIKKSMKYAAKNNEIFHLWWHPHNFGKNTDNNLKMLENILCEYRKLNSEYGMKSLNMLDLVNIINKKT